MIPAKDKAARKRYKRKVKRIVIELYPTDADMAEHLEKQDSKQGYIKSLILKDMRGG